MKLKAICITGGCAQVCALNALHRHFKRAHMDATYRIRNVDVVEAPTVNDVEESEGEGEEEDDESDKDNETGCKNMQEGGKENESDDGADDAVDEMDKADAKKEGELRTTHQRGKTSKRRRREKMLKRRHAMKQWETQKKNKKLEKARKKTTTRRTWFASLSRLMTAHLTMTLRRNKNSIRMNR
jgi:hypothetical protein